MKLYSEDNLNKLFSILKDTDIKNLIFIGLFAINKCPILLAEFLIDPECRITSIKIDSSLVDHEKLAIILEAFKINNTLQEINWSDTRIKAFEFKVFLASISWESNLKVLYLPNVENYFSYSDRLVDSLNNFFSKSNVSSLILNRCLTQQDIIELLPLIKTTNSRVFLRHDTIFYPLSFVLGFFEEFSRDLPTNALDMQGIYLNNVISYFLERNDCTISLSFSLAREISKESKKQLLASIRNSKIISCSIEQEQWIFGREIEQEKQLSKDIREITATNLKK